MKVLVTGSLGYIGTVLVPMLQAKDHDVTGVDTDLYQKCTFGGDLPGIRSIQTDIRDLGPDDLAGQEAVIHLAGLSNDPLGDYRPELTEAINATASINLARAARTAGVRRFLFASSCSNYGAAGDNFLDESERDNGKC